jgi:hypothetical protein
MSGNLILKSTYSLPGVQRFLIHSESLLGEEREEERKEEEERTSG